MPGRLARTQATDRSAIFDDVRDYIDFRIAFNETASGFLDRCPIQIAEAAAEGNEIVMSEPLVPESDHQVFQPDAMNLAERRVIQVFQFDVLDLRAEGCPARYHP